MSATETEAPAGNGPPDKPPRPEKVAVVTEVKERFSGSRAAVLADYRGLSVGEMARLRRSIKAAGGEFKIYKNTLVRFAVEELDLDLLDLLVGPNGIAFVEDDAVSVAKALRDFSRENDKLVIKGGLLGEQRLSAEEVDSLAKLPTRDELLARLAAGLAAPLQKFAGLLQALPRNFAYGLRALIDQGGAPGAPASPEPEAPTQTEAVEAPEAEAPEAEAPEAEAPEAEVATDTEDTADAAPEAETEPAPETTEASTSAEETADDTEKES
jgi:large subunit ribosomal protein L10